MPIGANLPAVQGQDEHNRLHKPRNRHEDRARRTERIAAGGKIGKLA